MTVLLIAATTGYQIRSFGDAATALGIRLVIASDRCDHLDDPWRDGAIAIRFHDVVTSTHDIVAALARQPADGIIAVGDRPTVLAAHVAMALGLPGNPPEAAERSRNKLAARDAFRAAGLPTPTYARVPLDDDVPPGLIDFPVVVKPLGLSGSRGVMRADTPQQLAIQVERLRRLLRSPDIQVERDPIHTWALIESFIPGREYAVEGVLTRGTLTVFAIFDKPDPLDGPFFEETIYVTPSRATLAVQRQIVDAIGAAARALGLLHGPVHAECRVNPAGVYVLEVAARPIGGLCSRALRFTEAGGSVSLEHVLLRHALGAPADVARPQGAASGVMMIPIPHRGILREVQGVGTARTVPLIDDVVVTAKRDAVLTPLPEGRSYLGFIFASGGSPQQVEEALRAAHGHLVVRLDRDLPLVASP